MKNSVSQELSVVAAIVLRRRVAEAMIHSQLSHKVQSYFAAAAKKFENNGFWVT